MKIWFIPLSFNLICIYNLIILYINLIYTEDHVVQFIYVVIFTLRYSCNTTEISVNHQSMKSSVCI